MHVLAKYISHLSVDAVKLSEIALGKQKIEKTFHFDIKIKEMFSNSKDSFKNQLSFKWGKVWTKIKFLLKSLNSLISVLHEFDVGKSVSNARNLLAGSTAVLLETLF